MTSTGLEQLSDLRKRINETIDQLSPSIQLRALSDVTRNHEQGPFASIDTQLIKLSALFGQAQALVDPGYVLNTALRLHVSSCMRVAIESHVEEQLREAGKPLNVDQLSKPTNINPDKLARCLRLLVAHHIFVEVEPNVFERNRHSATFDKHLSVAEILKNPNEQFSSGGGKAAIVAHIAEEGMKGSSYISDALLHNPRYAHSYEPKHSPFALAYGGDGLDVWSYFGKEGNAFYVKRFASAMRALPKGFPGKGAGFPWHELRDGAVVVDVGGGSGHLSLAIATSNPHLNLIVQDRPEVIEKDATIFWKENASEELRRRVELMKHDFFQPNPVKGADVYFLRAIIHDWSDQEAVAILSQLSKSASSSSKLVIIESVYEDLSKTYPPDSVFPYYLDIEMLAVVNAQERTESQYRNLGLRSGWKLVKTWKTGGERGEEEGTWRHYEFVVVEK